MNGEVVDGGYKTVEQSIVQVRAVVMRYDDSTRQWHHTVSSGSMSRVDIYHHTANHSFRVVGRSLEDREVTINAVIGRNLRYNKATPLFHQWRDSRNIYGLNFATEDDADSFASAIFSALELLNTLRDQQQQMASNPQPTKKSTAASTNIASPEKSDTGQYDTRQYDTRQYDSMQYDNTSKQYENTEKENVAAARQYEPAPSAKPFSTAADISTSATQRMTGGNTPVTAPPPPAPPLPPAAPVPLAPPIAPAFNAPAAPPAPPAPPAFSAPPAPALTPMLKSMDEEMTTASSSSSLDLASALKAVKLRKTAEVVADEENQSKVNRGTTIGTICKSKNPNYASTTGTIGRSSAGPPPAVPSKDKVMSEMARKLRERKEKAESGAGIGTGGDYGEGRTNLEQELQRGSGRLQDTYRVNQPQHLNSSESKVVTSDDHSMAELTLRHASSAETIVSGRHAPEDLRPTTTGTNSVSKSSSRPITMAATAPTQMPGRSAPQSAASQSLREELVVLREELLTQFREELEIAKRDIINAIRTEVWNQLHDSR